ncbi:MAG: ATP-binding protein, partial [Dehalococcoidia bacterium]
ELLLQQDSTEAMRREWLERVHKDSKRLITIVEDMLSISRIQSGNLATELEVLQMRSVVEEELDEIRPDADKHEFVVDIPSDIPGVVADRQKLTQVLDNLLGNAIKYSPQGGLITISVQRDRKRQRLITAVSDQGIGIAPGNQQDLFTAFHRIPRSETDSVRGSGLGLYIVKGFVELMNGEVWVESALGKGSTFSFSLPVAEVTPEKFGERAISPGGTDENYSDS